MAGYRAEGCPQRTWENKSGILFTYVGVEGFLKLPDLALDPLLRISLSPHVSSHRKVAGTPIWRAGTTINSSTFYVHVFNTELVSCSDTGALLCSAVLGRLRPLFLPSNYHVLRVAGGHPNRRQESRCRGTHTMSCAAPPRHDSEHHGALYSSMAMR